MNWWDNLQTGFGDALIGVNNPFGFAPSVGYDRNAAIRSGALNLGLNMLANSNANPMEAIGKGYREAQDQAGRQQMQAIAAQEMMQRADENRKKREEEAQARQRQAQYLQALSAKDPNAAAMLEAYPELAADYIKQTQFPQTADAVANWGMSVVPLKNRKTGELVAGQFNQGQGGIFINGEPADPNEWSYDPGALAQDRAQGSMLGNAPKTVIDEYNKKIRPAISETATALSAVDEAEKLLANVQTGSGAEITQALRGWGATIGLNVDESVLADTQKYQNFISQVVVPRMQALGGNDSNEELRYLKSTMGGDITQAKTALQATLSLTKKLLQKRMEGYRAIEGYVLPMLPGLPPVPDVSPLNTLPGSGGGLPDLSTMTDEELEAIANGKQ